MEEVMLGRGDGMLFRGREHPHYRNPLPGGKTCSNLLIHFVKMDFPTNITREEHNNQVCCSWPPQREFNYEECMCLNPELRSRKSKLQSAVKFDRNKLHPTMELIHENR
jgi:hypothetical protein